MKFKIKLTKNTGIVLFFIVIILGLYFQYVYTKQNLIQRYKNKDISNSLQIRDKFKSILNDAEIEFKINLDANIKALNTLYIMYNNIKSFNATNVARILNEENKGPGRYEVFVIDRKYRIIKASYKPDLGYNLGTFSAFKKVLDKVFNGKEKIDISYVHLDIASLNLKRYFLILSPDKKYLLQIAYVIDIYPKLQKTYYKLKAKYKDLKDLQIYFADKYLIYPVNLDNRYSKKIPLKTLTKISFNLFERILKETQEYSKYKKLLKSKNFELLGRSVVKIFQLHNGVISKIDLKQHTINVVTIIQGFFKTLTNKLIIKSSFSTKELEKSLDLIKFRFLLFLSALLIIILFFKYIIFYMSKNLGRLVDSMKANKKIEKTNSFIEEIDGLISTYNCYRDKLNEEIKKNKGLLNENKRFVVDTIHQIKTPLSIIALNSDFIKMQTDNKDILESVEEIEAAISMLKHSYDDLSYMASKNVVNYKPANLDFSSILKERVKFFSVLAKARNKKIITDIEDDIFLNMNKVELERIIDNNISNAIDYSKKEKIFVELKKRENFIIFKVASFGDKIKDTKKIFEKNYREQEHKRGIGIGLNIVKTICEKYNIKYSAYYQDGQNIFEYKFVTIT